MDFNPLRPRGRRQSPVTYIYLVKEFQPTPPARTETGNTCVGLTYYEIFQPTPPARTETIFAVNVRHFVTNFNPLRPRGRRQDCYTCMYDTFGISTHSAREDGDDVSPFEFWSSYNFNPLRPRGRRPDSDTPSTVMLVISTHSAREDGDVIAEKTITSRTIFQPTPPARTETASMASIASSMTFQPTPPARTETLFKGIDVSYFQDFNPLRPRGRRP